MRGLGNVYTNMAAVTSQRFFVFPVVMNIGTHWETRRYGRNALHLHSLPDVIESKHTSFAARGSKLISPRCLNITWFRNKQNK